MFEPEPLKNLFVKVWPSWYHRIDVREFHKIAKYNEVAHASILLQEKYMEGTREGLKGNYFFTKTSWVRGRGSKHIEEYLHREWDTIYITIICYKNMQGSWIILDYNTPSQQTLTISFSGSLIDDSDFVEGALRLSAFKKIASDINFHIYTWTSLILHVQSKPSWIQENCIRHKLSYKLYIHVNKSYT